MHYYILFFLLFPCFAYGQTMLGGDSLSFTHNFWGKVGELPEGKPKLKLLRRVGDTRFMHPSRLAKSVYSFDEQTIIASGGAYISAWNAEEGTLKWKYALKAKRARVLMSFKTKPWILVGNDSGLSVILHHKTGEKIMELKSLPKKIACADISSNERYIFIAGYKGEFLFWDLEREEEITLYNLPELKTIYTVKLSNTGRYLALGGEMEGKRAFLLYDLTTNNITSFPLHKQHYGHAVAFTKDDRHIALGYFGAGLEYRSTDDGALIWSLKGYDESILFSLEFIKDDKKLVALLPRRLVLIDVASGNSKVLKETIDSNVHFDDFDLNANNTEMILTERGTYRVNQYLFPSMKPIFPRKVVITSPPEHMLFSPDGAFFITAGDGTRVISIWDTQTQNRLKTLDFEAEAGIYSLRFSPNGKHLAILWSPVYTKTALTPLIKLTVYAFPSLKKINERTDVSTHVRDFCFVDDQRLALFDYKWASSYLNFPTLESSDKEEFNFSTYYLDEMSMALAENLWGYRYSNLLHWLNTYVRPLLTVDPYDSAYKTAYNPSLFGGLSKNGRHYAAISQEQILYIYNTDTGKTKAGIPMEGLSPYRLAISPKSDIIVVSDMNTSQLLWYGVE